MAMLILILIWIICSIITYGVLRYVLPNEVVGDELVIMLSCLAIWPVLILMLISVKAGRFALDKMSDVGELVAGFIGSIFKGKK